MDVLTTRSALLQLLRESPGYGLDLIRRLRRQSGLALAESRVYPALKRLERDGLAAGVPVAPRGERGARGRVYYHLTPSGLAAAAAERRRLQALLAPPPARRWTRREREAMARRLLEADALAEAADELRAAGAR